MKKIGRKWMLAGGGIGLGVVAAAALAQTGFPLMPSVAMETDGTLHFKDREIPLPAKMSEEARAKYIQIAQRNLAFDTTDTAELAKQFFSDASAGSQLRAMPL